MNKRIVDKAIKKILVVNEHICNLKEERLKRINELESDRNFLIINLCIKQKINLDTFEKLYSDAQSLFDN